MIATHPNPRGGAGFNLPTPACGRVSSHLLGHSIRGAKFTLVLALAFLLAGCLLQGKKPVAQPTPAAPAPAAKSAAPSQPLSVRQTQVELRSEERRGGKECRTWWWPFHLTKKT